MSAGIELSRRGVKLEATRNGHAFVDPDGRVVELIQLRQENGMPAKQIENTIPVLPVHDLDRSVEFFRRTLGFDLEWKTREVCSIARDGCRIMLQRSSNGSRATVWIGLEDDSLYAKLAESGVTVVQAPTRQPWAYEMKIADPDGNTLWLGTDPKDA